MRITEEDRLWIGLIVAAATTAVVVLFVTSGEDVAWQRLEHLDLPARALPAWGATESLDTSPVDSRAPQSLEIFVDTSHPMGGFVPLDSSSETGSPFRTVVHLVSDHLVRIFAHAEDEVRWSSVDTELRSTSGPPVFDRSGFRGADTNLDLAVAEALERFRRGESRAAALISDLVATRDVTGALGVSKALSDWLRSADLRDEKFDVGLLGVRSPYWGVSASSCPLRAGLGCWYSERARAYWRMSEPALRPFYVLILGRRDALGASAPGSAIDDVGRALLASAENLGLDAQWELLTVSTAELEGRIHCDVTKPDGEAQFALLASDDGRIRCRSAGEVRLSCRFSPAEAELHLTLAAPSTTWASVVPEASEDGGLSLTVDCSSLRSDSEGVDLRLNDPTGTPVGSGDPRWQDWSCETDESEESLGRDSPAQLLRGTSASRAEGVSDLRRAAAPADEFR